MKLLTVQEVADLLRAQPSTLRFWRHKGTGPPSFKTGRRVLYREADVLSWLESQRATTSSGAA